MYPVTHLVVHNQNPDAAPVLPPALETRTRVRRAERAWRVHADAVAIRIAGPADADALFRLAQADGLPGERFALLAGDGGLLVAEHDGRAVAALDVERGTVVADPFEQTAGLVDLLRIRARQLRGGAPRVLRPRLH